MSQILTPDQLVAELRTITNRLTKGTTELNKLEVDSDRFLREYEWAKARVMLTAEGSVQTKMAQAELETQPERTAYEVARAAFNYARNLLKSLETSHFSVMAQLKAIDATYRSAGRE